MSGSRRQCGRAVTAATLRQCREVLEISQAALAAELGVSPETYRVWDSDITTHAVWLARTR